jgi:hypothetical protein
MNITMSDIRSAAADALLAEYEQGVTEQHNSDRILEYYSKCGCDWAVRDGFNPGRDYWCGVAVGWAYVMLGEHIDETTCYDIRLRHSIAQNMMPSTTRLAGKGPKSWPSIGIPAFKRIDFEDIERGDICVVATGRTTREWGDHITLATGSPNLDADIPSYPTVEGNVGDKIVKRRRKFTQTAVVYRVGIEHLTGSMTKEIDG